MLHGVAWCWVSDGVGCCMVLRGVACRMKLGVAWCCVVLGVGWCWVLHGVAWCCVSDEVGCCMVLRGVDITATLGKQHSDNRVLRNNTYTLSQGFKARRVFAVFKHVVELCKHPFWGALLRLQHAERASSGKLAKRGNKGSWPAWR